MPLRSMRTLPQLSLAAVVSVFAAACGEPPQRIVSEKPPTAPSVQPAPKPGGVRFAGTIVLAGALSESRKGAVFVSARRKGQRLPALSRKYDIGDPAWSVGDGARTLPFELTDADNMGGFGAPMGGDMEVEARYSPSGFIDPSPGSEEAGVMRASVPAAPGDRGLSIRLASGK